MGNDKCQPTNLKNRREFSQQGLGKSTLLSV